MFAADTDLSSWANVGGTVLSGGFAGVLTWWLLTRALPKMQDDFRSSLKDQQTEFRSALRELQSESRASLKELQDKHDRGEELRRAEGKAGLDSVLEHCERENERRDVRHKADMELMLRQVNQNSEILEELRVTFLERVKRRRGGNPPPGPK